MATTTFNSIKTALTKILEDIGNGKTQLPDFQRGWVWDDDRVRDLLASVAASFPIGTIMTLEAGGKDIKLQPRPIEGTHSRITDEDLDTLILDGQQRMTSLYQSLMCKEPVATKDAKNKKIKRFYYISMEKALKDRDLQEAIDAVSEERIRKGFGGEVALDLSTPVKEYKQHLFPVNQLLDYFEWQCGYHKFWEYDQEKTKFFNEFVEKVIQCFKGYQVPIIKLDKDTPKEAVCLVFEKVNTGGMSLTVFELLTATFAADNFNLREDWDKRKEKMKSDVSRILKKPESDHFLQVISLLVTRDRRERATSRGITADQAPGISCKRRDILNLTVEEYQTWADKAEKGFIEAARFLNSQKIFRAEDVPYRTQLVPLTTILVILGKDGEKEGAKRKLARWYWCGVLGELYGGAIETRFALDLPQVVEFVRGSNSIPKTISEAHFASERLKTLRTRNSAAYKGLYALLMRDGCRDFRTGETVEAMTFYSKDIDIHHVFPRKWCDDPDNKIPEESYNSIINKTALSSPTNRIIGGNAPSKYLKKLEKEDVKSSDVIDNILESHGIDPEVMRADDYWKFYRLRAEYLLGKIEKATEMKIERDEQLFSSDAQADSYEDDDE